MALYDLFIKGIRPDRLDQADQIKKKASQSFKIEVDQLEALWSTPSGLCIRRNISREEASQIQHTLAKAGLICLNTPSTSGVDLSLAAKEDKKTSTTHDFTCPYCAIKIVIDNNQPDPIECPECSGIIAKYAEIQERKEIRNRLMNLNATREKQEIQLIKEDAERIRKKKIEDEISQEIFGKQKIKISKPLLIAGGTAILIASGATYFLTAGGDKVNNIAANTTTSSASSEKKTTAVASKDNSAAAIALSGDAPPATFSSGGPSDAQSALQDTHDKANKVLGAFGLNADNLGKNAGGASSPPATQLDSISSSSAASDNSTATTSREGIDSQPTQGTQESTALSGEIEKLVSIPPSSATSDNSVATTSRGGIDAQPTLPSTPESTVLSGGTEQFVSSQSNASPGIIKKPIQPGSIQPEDSNVPLTMTLLHDGDNDQEWDLFLNQHVTHLIESNKLTDAYKLAQQLIDTEGYIDTMGLLLAHAQKSNENKLINEITTALENKINTLPASNQAEYLAQAGFYQLHITKKNDLLTRAETAWKQITNADDQLKAALKIAVYNFKSGNIKTANHYFNQVNNLLAKNKTPDEQVSARAAIAQAYYDVNDSANAVKWLSSATNFIPEASSSSLKELIGSYAYANQFQTNTVQNIAKEKQGELLYRAIQVSLKSNLLDKAVSVSNDLQDPTYKALASDLIASYNPKIANSSLEVAEKQLQSLNLPADKAIVASRLARHYFRIGNIQKATELMVESEKQLKNLPSSSTKDHVLALTIKNFAQALQFDTADNLLFFIHTDAIKSSLKNHISQLKGLTLTY